MRKKLEHSLLTEVIESGIYHLRHSFSSSKICKLMNAGTEWMV